MATTLRTTVRGRLRALPADVAPADRYVASIGGIQNFASNFAGIISPIMVGYLVDKTSSFAVPLMVISCGAPAGRLHLRGDPQAGRAHRPPAPGRTVKIRSCSCGGAALPRPAVIS
ncbi:hypothetical protein [Nonomuraea sp. JJY05]|jgi:hypothetical protein|uniref:hypothetical protein n=1 Tax=Nonomuraea sp. JJY05 TaxID=3350255 RepID=UPI00373F806C